MRRQLTIITLSTLINVLAGCASDRTDTILPQTGPTMKEVYESHFTGQALPKVDEGDEPEKALPEADQTEIVLSPITDNDLVAYTRDASNEINQLFPRLANPTLVMYIYPHLAGSERHPVPGYATAFTLYEKVEYALPGEPQERD